MRRAALISCRIQVGFPDCVRIWDVGVGLSKEPPTERGGSDSERVCVPGWLQGVEASTTPPLDFFLRYAQGCITSPREPVVVTLG